MEAFLSMEEVWTSTEVNQYTYAEHFPHVLMHTKSRNEQSFKVTS